jgi:poly(hydroxyalkanoate) granule-associated protein
MHFEMPTEAAHKVWLAGIGALSMAEEEGSKLFKTLVDKGKKNHKLADLPEETWTNVRHTAEKVTGKVGTGIEDTVQTVLHRMGVPTRDEIANLTRRVEAMTKNVKMPARRKTTARKPTRVKAQA